MRIAIHIRIRVPPLPSTARYAGDLGSARTKPPGFALQALERPGLVSRLSAPGSPEGRRPLRAGSGPTFAMARAYQANDEWAVHDFYCDCFGVPDQETENELFSRSADRDRCRLARHGQCARDMRPRPDTPSAEDACPSLPGQLVVRTCFVCCATYSESAEAEISMS